MNFSIRSYKTYVRRAIMAVLVLAAVLYAGDWIVFRARLARATAYDSVEVDQFLATPLKGNKVEYDIVGSYQQQCARSIFPRSGKPACWWVRRHTEQWE